MKNAQVIFPQVLSMVSSLVLRSNVCGMIVQAGKENIHGQARATRINKPEKTKRLGNYFFEG